MYKRQDVPVPLVREAEELGGQLASALFKIKLRGFHSRALPFQESVTMRHLLPCVEKIVAHGAVRRCKIAESGKWLKASVWHNLEKRMLSEDETVYRIPMPWQVHMLMMRNFGGNQMNDPM